jgi:hypothetical protein
MNGKAFAAPFKKNTHTHSAPDESMDICQRRRHGEDHASEDGVQHSHRIQKHFELRIWHCVSENFEAVSLMRSVIELAAANNRCDLPA